MGSPPLTITVADGQACAVEFAVRSNGECPGKKFWEEDCELIRAGSKSKPDSTARAKFAVLFQQLADKGAISPKRFKKEMGMFFAFRHEVRGIQIRFPCFQDGKKWIVTHGFPKPGGKKGLGEWPESEVKRAEEIRAEYIVRKRGLEKLKGGK